MFIRVLSLSKFRFWLTEGFSSNKAAGSHQRQKQNFKGKQVKAQKSGKSQYNKRRGKTQKLSYNETF